MLKTPRASRASVCMCAVNETARLQGSRVRPNFSRVRLTKIPGCTGASSHSRKEKKVSATIGKSVFKMADIDNR